MAEKRKRGQNFTTEEKEKLVKLLMDHKNTILNKKTDGTHGTTNEAKLLAWNKLTASFNATASIHRSKESLLKVWEKLKSESKTYYASTRRSASQTGGGPSIIKIDPILEQVCSMMGRGCSGIEGIRDSDAKVDIVEAIYVDDPLQKVICVENEVEINQVTYQDITETVQDITETVQDEPKEVAPQEKKIASTPLWSRRRPISSNMNERSEAVNNLCSSYKEINKKKEDVENLKYMLLKDELETKSKLHKLQLQAAEKDLIIKDLDIEIKKSILEQIKGGLALQNLFGAQHT